MKKGFLISYYFLSAKLRIKSSYYWLREIETGIPLHFNLRQYSSNFFAASFLCGLKLFCKVECVFLRAPDVFFLFQKEIPYFVVAQDTFSISVRLLFCHNGSVQTIQWAQSYISNSHHNSLKLHVISSDD